MELPANPLRESRCTYVPCPPCPSHNPRVTVVPACYKGIDTMKRFLLPLVALCFAVFSMAAHAKTYECKAVEEIAKLGISPRPSVAVSSDTDRKICKFSVNGAKVSSPPQARISQAFENLFNAGELYGGNWSSDDLAAMLLSAGPDSDIRDMSELIDSVRRDIQPCIQSLNAGNVHSNDLSLSDFGVNGICVVSTNQPVEYGSIAFRFGDNDAIPVLLLFIQRSHVTNLLAIPRR